MKPLKAAQHLHPGTEAVEIRQSGAQTFRFGNNGKVDCTSNTAVQVSLEGQTGSMQVAVHEIHGQPVLPCFPLQLD